MNKKTVISLDIYSWSGLSLGAIHYYGELRHPSGKKSDRLQRPLSIENAINLNRRLRLTHSESQYDWMKVEPGEMDYRFDTEEDVIETAKNQWLNIFPDGEVLIDYHDNSIIYAERTN